MNLHEDKQSFPQADTVVFGGCSQICPNYQKISLQYLSSISTKEGGISVHWGINPPSKTAPPSFTPIPLPLL